MHSAVQQGVRSGIIINNKRLCGLCSWINYLSRLPTLYVFCMSQYHIGHTLCAFFHFSPSIIKRFSELLFQVLIYRQTV